MNGREESGCILCGPAAETTLVWADTRHSRIWRCRGCGLTFRSPRHREEEQIRHFAEAWTEARAALYLEEYRQGNLRRLVRWAFKRHPAPGAVLDIGSSYGNLLAQIPATWRRFGVEPAHLACQVGQGRLPEALIIRGTLSSADLPAAIFDVITIIDTIFYLPHPLRDLARVPELLKPNGILLIESFNFTNRGPLYRWLRHPFGEHFLYFYTPKNLEKVLAKVGMKAVARIDLQGHQTGSKNQVFKAMTWAEYALTKAARKCSQGWLDLVPHFVLVSSPEKSCKLGYGH